MKKLQLFVVSLLLSIPALANANVLLVTEICDQGVLLARPEMIVPQDGAPASIRMGSDKTSIEIQGILEDGTVKVHLIVNHADGVKVIGDCSVAPGDETTVVCEGTDATIKFIATEIQ